MFLSLPDFIGRFHPVLVHLPIGILLLACFFQLLTVKAKFAFLQPAVPVILFWGMLGAVFSCISGYILSLSGDYEEQLVGRHQWLGIATAVVSFVLWLLYRFSISVKTTRIVSVVIIALITVTGHLGGSLTHGSNYLTEGLQSGAEQGTAIKPIPNIQEAVVYTDVVQPLLEAKCYSCHGASKQKGKLRLDQQEYIVKGGKTGYTMQPGNADESEMIKRMLLPVDNEDHMPPKEKSQLTAQEISLLHWWVNSGAHFNKKVKELPQTEKIKPVLLSLQAGSSDNEEKVADVPVEPVAKADEAIINRLKKAGVIVIPVAQNSNYLSVNFVAVTNGIDSLLQLLQQLSKQLVWLKLDHAAINDASMDVLSKLTTLTRLQLSNATITDKGLLKLQSLQQLQSLNLTGTKVTAQGVMQLKGLKKLKHLYLYQTAVGSADWVLLHQSFPAAQLDSGKYTVPALASDTTLVTAPKK
ncbi:c-type cytochrome domain-containing protein [Lacibacter sp. H407]|uniref:c-type cytochrome domain-containing protein n=1 Tax=Lacibacter sp. H407 TaxID=3133423 RepID=UPI0030C321C4